MGKKYIIELEEQPFYSGNPQVIGIMLKAERLYRVKGFKSLVFDEEGIKRLTPYEEPRQKEHVNFVDRLNEAVTVCWEGNRKSFADACGITEVSLSRYLSGDRVPKAPVIIAMANALGVSADYLLGLEDKE